MTTTQHVPAQSGSKAPKPARNGVDLPGLLATINAVGAQPELGQFQFRARNRWISGTHSRSTIKDFYGAGQEDTSRSGDFVMDADHPAVFMAEDHGPTPVEYLLHAIAACVTAGIATSAAARGIDLYEVESTVEGDLSVLGLTGLSKDVRNGYQDVRVHFRVRGDATPEQLEALVAQSRDRSAVYDVLTNGVPVHIDVTTE